MISFTVHSGKEKMRLTAPSGWNELTLSQLIKIENEDLQKDGLIKLFSILCGVDFNVIANSTDKTLYETIREVCAFVGVPPNWEKIERPNHIQIGQDVHKSPKDVNKLMHGQIELMTELGKETNLLQQMARGVAIIMQPSIDKGDYDGERVDEIEEEAKEANGLACYGLALFFFRKSVNFLSIGIKSSKEYLKATQRRPTYYNDWLKVADLQGIPL